MFNTASTSACSLSTFLSNPAIGLTDHQLLRKAVREGAISVVVVATAVARQAATLVSTNPAEVGVLLRITHGMFYGSGVTIPGACLAAAPPATLILAHLGKVGLR
jgi:hypothetical protein